MKLIQIDPKEIQIFKEEGGKFLFKPEAEEALIKLIDTRDMLNEAVDEVLEKIRETGEKINPDFKGVKGENINLTKRKYGTKYGYKRAKTGTLGPYLKNVSYNIVDSEKVERYLEELGELPDGVFEKDRDYKLSVRRANEKDSS